MKVLHARRLMSRRQSRVLLGVIGALLAVLAGVIIYRMVMAAPPTPVVTFTSDMDTKPLIGEKTTFTLQFQNQGGSDVGFGPYVDMLLPEDFSNPSVEYLGKSLHVRSIGPFLAGVETCINHPLAKQSDGSPVEVCLTPTEETTLYVVQLPFGSFADSQPVANLAVAVDVASDTTVSESQTISARGGFYLGTDALSNPTQPDPSIIGSFQHQQVEPTVLKVRKQYISTDTDDSTVAYMKNEYEIVPGANHYQRFRITANIADGSDLENLVLRDVLPAPLKLIGVDMVGAHSVTPSGFTDHSDLVTNTVDLRWAGPLTGTSSATDAQFDVIFEVPYKDTADAVSWTRSIGNTVTADAVYGGDDLPTVTEPIRDGNNGTRQLTIKPMITQKSVAKVGSGAIKPSDTLEYTIRMYLSDYIALNNVRVSDVLDDGLTYVPGSAQMTLPGQSATNVTPSVNIDAATSEETLGFDLSSTTLVGGCVPVGGLGADDPDCSDHNSGRTIVTLVFRASIDEAYDHDGSTVYQGNILNNHVTTTADILDLSDLASATGTVSDSSDAWVRITEGSFEKSIYAVNGDTNLPSRLKPGDDITYRLRYTVPNTDFDSLQLDDYLPLPMFSASTVTTFDATYPYSGTTPAAGTASFGPGETLHAFAGAVPTISHPGGNIVRFNWAGQSDNSNTTRVIDVLFTVEISNQPYAPGLFITNQATSTESNVKSITTNTVIQSIEMEIPEPVITKGAVQTDAASPSYTPSVPPAFSTPGSSGTRFSGVLANGSAVDTNLTGVDAGDVVTYVMVVENTGKGGMHDARLRDELPENMQIPSGGRNLRVTDGTGAPLDYFDHGGSAIFDITLEYAVPGSGSTPGQNVVVITYDLQVTDDIQSRDIVTNTAQLSRFAAEYGGVNYVVDQSQYQDDATVTTTTPSMNKTIIGTSLPDSETNGTNVVVGEEVTYQISTVIPEGTLRNARIIDTLGTCLAVTRVNSITASPGVVASTHGGDWNAIRDNAVIDNPATGVANDGRRVTFDFGTLRNTNTDNATQETVTISLNAVVLNATGCTQGQVRNNTAVLEWGDSTPRETVTATSPNVTIREPAITLTKDVVPTSGDANDIFPVTLRIRGDNTSSRPPAYNVIVTDKLSDYGFTYVDGLTVSSGAPAPDNLNATGNTITAEWDRLPQTADITITFNARLTSDSHPSGSSHSNTAQATFTSYPGVPTGINTHNTLACERTGEGASASCGQVNNYSRSANDAYVISNVVNLQKSIVQTSEVHTNANSGTGSPSGVNVAIGEVIRYRMTMQVPESTTNNVVIRDVLPAGLEYRGLPRIALVGNGAGGNTVTSSTISGAFVSGNSPSITPTTDIPSGAVTVASQQIDFNLGTLRNADDDADSEYVVIEFNALVRNTAVNARSGNIDNQFTVRVGGVQQGTPSSVVRAIVQEPNVSVQKTVTNPPHDAGDMVEYTLVVRNTAGANVTTGYDLVVNDQLHQWLTGATIQSVSTLPYGGVITQSVTAATNPGTNHDVVSVNIPELRPGDSVTIVIRATVHNNAQASFSLPNTAVVTTTSLPGSNGTITNPTGQQTPGSTNDPNGERRQSTNHTVTTPLNSPAITKTGPTEGTTTTIGSTVTYPITVRVPQGVTQNIVVTDNLPDGLAYISHSVDISTLPSGTTIANPQANWRTQPAGSPGVDGQDVVFNLGTVSVPGDGTQNASFVITVVARVLDIPTNITGTTLSNTATVRYTNPNATGDLTITTPPANVQIQEPRLALTKTLSGNGMRNVGDTLAYTVEVTNTGTATAHQWHIDDILPSHTTLSVAPTCTVEGSPILTTQGVVGGVLTITPLTGVSLVVGEKVRCTYSLTVGSTAVVGSTYTNTADVDWYSAPNGTDGRRNYNDTPGNAMDQNQDTDSASFTMTGAGFTKAVDRTTATIGEVRTYTLTVNAPSGVVQGFTVEDTLPAGLEFVGTTEITNVTAVTPTVSGTGPTVVAWDFGTISHNGQPITVTYQARVANIAANQNGQTRINTAQVHFTPEGASQVTETDNATVSIEEPELTVAKTSNRTTARYGQEVEYTLTVNHSINSLRDAYNVRVADTLPSGMTLVAGSVSASGWNVSESSTGFTATRDTLMRSGGATIITYRARVSAPPATPLATLGSTLTNTAQLTWTSLEGDSAVERTGTGGVNDYATVDGTDVTASAINLVITKSTTSTSVQPGGQIIYNLEVQNTGNALASGVRITETVPAHTTFTGTPSGWTCENGGVAGSICTYEVGGVADGASQNVQFTVNVDEYADLSSEATAIENHVRVAANDESGSEVRMDDNEDTVTVPLEIADIGVVKSDDVDPVLHIHHDYNYRITVTNHSTTTTATHVRIHDALPSGVVFNGFVTMGTASCSEVNSVIDCEIASLAPGETVVLEFNVTGNVPGRVTNEVTAQADQQDPNRANNRDTEETLIDPADLEIKKTVSKSAASIGGEVVYTLMVTNHGPDITTDVVVEDMMPDGLQVISAKADKGACTVSGRQVRCTVATLAVDEVMTMTLIAKANALGLQVNHATVASNEYDPNLTNNESSATVMVLPLAPDTGIGRTVYGIVAVGIVVVIAMIGTMIYRRRRV